jgi:formimidoylglutamate deiminase
MPARWLEFTHLHQEASVLSPGFVQIDAQGTIRDVSGQRPRDAQIEQVPGLAVPGLPNLHSHAFQRAMAGMAERASRAHEADSFWTWRERMYDVALTIEPHELQAIAAQLYVEMLEAGMTCAAEFHYLHHAPDGSAYGNASELAEQVIAAADTVGMSLTMLPVFYAHAGVGKPISQRQRRFAHATVRSFVPLLERLRSQLAGTVHRLGLAPHSLRAVAPRELEELLVVITQLDPSAPIHLHIAEQTAEVDEVLAGLGSRPVTWLLEHAPVDPRFCLVHATHATPEECVRVAGTGAVIGLCPETEANLGDGIFPLPAYARAQGAFGVGTDSQVRVSSSGELRMLEYPQRLVQRARNVLAARQLEHTLSTGRRLFDACTLGGARACAQPVGRIAPGLRADLVVLDLEHPRMIGHAPASLLDAFIFSAGDAAIRHVMARGEWLVRDGRHRAREPVERAFKQAMTSLWSRV